MLCGATVGQPDPGAHPADQAFQPGKTMISRIPDPGKERDMVSQQGNADRDEKQALQNRQEKSHDPQRNKDPPENQP